MSRTSIQECHSAGGGGAVPREMPDPVRSLTVTTTGPPGPHGVETVLQQLTHPHLGTVAVERADEQGQHARRPQRQPSQLGFELQAGLVDVPVGVVDVAAHNLVPQPEHRLHAEPVAASEDDRAGRHRLAQRGDLGPELRQRAWALRCADQVQRLALLLALRPHVVDLSAQRRQLAVHPRRRACRPQRLVLCDLDQALDGDRGAQQDSDVEHAAARDGLRAAEEFDAAPGEGVRWLVEGGQQGPQDVGELREGTGRRTEADVLGPGSGRGRRQLDAVLLGEEPDAYQFAGAEVVGQRLERPGLRAVLTGVRDAFLPRRERHRVDHVHVGDPGLPQRRVESDERPEGRDVGVVGGEGAGRRTQQQHVARRQRAQRLGGGQRGGERQRASQPCRHLVPAGRPERVEEQGHGRFLEVGGAGESAAQRLGEQIRDRGRHGVTRDRAVPRPDRTVREVGCVLRQLVQRLEERGLQLVRRGHRRRRHTAVPEPRPERLLVGSELQVPEQGRWALGVLADQEH